MAYPITKLRELFTIAVDVQDSKLEKAFMEADRLDYKPQTQMYYDLTPEKYKSDATTYTGADTVLCYYAFARYVQTSEQESTATGVKVQNYLNSYTLPDNSKAKRFEAERGKADLFIVDLLNQLKADGILKCECKERVQSRICLIK